MKTNTWRLGVAIVSRSSLEHYARAFGAYLGLAVGDALGAPLEFMSAQAICQRYGVVNTMLGGGWLNVEPGEVTDDTEMTVVMARAILEERGFDLQSIANAWAAWLKHGPKDIGATCKRGILRYMREGSLSKALDDRDAGNGACMRNLPVALLTLEDKDAFFQHTIAQCHFTHHHPLSAMGTLAFYRMVQRLILGEGKKAAQAEVNQLIQKEPLFSFDPYPGKSSGYIVDTLQTVFHGYFTTNNFADCLIKVVNLGGDADTTGALAGILAGATYGQSAIPSAWRHAISSEILQAIVGQTKGLLELAADHRAG